MNFTATLLNFDVNTIKCKVDIPSMINFLKKNLGRKSILYLDYDDSIPYEDDVILQSALSRLRDEWEPQNDRPIFFQH